MLILSGLVSLHILDKPALAVRHAEQQRFYLNYANAVLGTVGMWASRHTVFIIGG